MDKYFFGETLKLCCSSPKMDILEMDYCRTSKEDYSKHTVCAIVTKEF